MSVLTPSRTVAAIITQIIYTHQKLYSADPTFDTWPVVLCAEVVQCTSTVTACIPNLKPFLESLESGMLRADDLKRRGIDGSYGSSGNRDESAWKHSRSSHRASNPSGSPPGRSSGSPNGQYELTRPTPGGGGGGGDGVPYGSERTGYSVSATGGHALRSEWDAESQSSVSQMIRQTKTWAIDARERIGAIGGGGGSSR
jgi:hypothetical protein